jgi:hypothetical protein
LVDSSIARPLRSFVYRSKEGEVRDIRGIGLTDSRLRLRRQAGGRLVADADVLRSVLRDGDALDLELPADVIAADR